jgi:hypothetical protein
MNTGLIARASVTIAAPAADYRGIRTNNLTDEARAERNWSVMLAGLKHFAAHNRPMIDTEPD